MILALILVAFILITRFIASTSTPKATNYVWEFWARVAPSSSMRELRAKRDELMQVRTERSNTSSQDEFAKWARLDRQHQKIKKEYDTMNTTVQGNRQKLASLISGLKFLVSKGLMWSVMWYYRKSPVVWLPHHALPHRVEQMLALPFAPIGSISVANWVYSVEATIKAGSKLYKSFTSVRASAAVKKAQ